MKLLLVSYTHPDTQHVAAQRFPTFARELADQGHKVVLITAHRPGDAGTSLATLEAALQTHNWQRPFHVSVPLAAAKSRLPGVAGRLQTAYGQLADGHVPEWPRGARRFFPALSNAFKADLVWAVFGSVSDLVVGNEAAILFDSAFVIDFKDNVDEFIPGLIAHRVAQRFSRAIGATCNSRFHGDAAIRYFHWLSPQVVYSGVSHELLSIESNKPHLDAFEITYIGGSYDRGRLLAVRDVLEDHLVHVQKVLNVQPVLHVVPGQNKTVAKDLGSMSCKVIVHPYLTHRELVKIFRRSVALIYMSSSKTFHHKLFELLASHRIVIAVGGEHEESKRLTREVGGQLVCCETDDEFNAAIQKTIITWQTGTFAKDTLRPEMLCWSAFAKDLNKALSEAHSKHAEQNGDRFN